MIETNSTFISKIDDDIIQVIVKSGAVLGHEEYDTFEEIYYELAGGKRPLKFIVIIEENARLKQKIVNFFSKNYKTDFKIAEAYLIKDPMVKMFFRVGKRILNKRRNYPVQEFNNEEEAVSWLKTIHKF